MASINIDVREIVKALGKASDNLLNLTPLFKNIADLTLSETKLRYRDGLDPDGNEWRDPITIRRDGNGGRTGGYTQEESWNYVLKSNYHAVPPGWHWFDKSRGDKVMRDTSVLYNSLGIAYGKDYAVVGTNLQYGKTLQDGDFPFLGITLDTYANVEDVLDSYLKGIFK